MPPTVLFLDKLNAMLNQQVKVYCLNGGGRSFTGKLIVVGTDFITIKLASNLTDAHVKQSAIVGVALEPAPEP